MKVAVFSDIHANLEAFELALADATRKGAERVVSLGDIVGYGPLPAETLKRVKETCAVALAGNHDDAVSGRVDPDAFIALAGDAVKRHREALSEDALDWLKKLPYTARLGGALLVHGDATDPQVFHYIETTDDARANFEATEEQLIFVGHTHVPKLFLVGHSGTVYETPPQDFVLEPGKRYIVNVGSVGYPREADGKCLSSYVLYDTEEKSVTFETLPFSVASVMQRGVTPRKTAALKWTILLAVLLALLAGGLAFFLSPENLVLASRELALEPGTDALRANLFLAKGSAPVDLKIRYFDANGREINSDGKPVKAYSKGTFNVPKGASRAELTVSKQDAEADVTIESFSPQADRRTGS